MRTHVLLMTAAASLLLLLAREKSARARSATRPRRSRWKEQLAPFQDGRWKAEAPAWAVPLVEDAERQTSVPSALLAALIRTESAWKPYVVSSAGAIGLAQLIPATAAEVGVNPWEPAENVLGGARYLRKQLETFDDVALALAAYNAGPHRVHQYGGIPPYPETQAYVTRILSRLGS